ncbi:MAG: hypothetical protein FWC41_10540, partial [Firmicutes bacterium]|nr:hypothetical protein [Bacillota bacterium]
YDKYQAFAYVCSDIKRRADETVRLLKEAKEDKLSDEKILKKLKRAGKFVLLSATNGATNEILPLYHLRQSAEQIFQISKNHADILPLRIHSEAAFRGLLFLNFLTVVMYINFRKQLPKNTSVEDAMKQMRNMMCKIYDENYIVTAEPNKKQKSILKNINSTVGKF